MDPQFLLPSNPFKPDKPINISLPLALPSAQTPIIAPTAMASPTPDLLDTVAPPQVVLAASVTTPAAISPTGTAATEGDVAPLLTTPAATLPTASPAAGHVVTPVTNADSVHPVLSLFMHDILGGPRPSGRVVTWDRSQLAGQRSTFLRSQQSDPTTQRWGLTKQHQQSSQQQQRPLPSRSNGLPSSNDVLQNNGNNNVINSGTNLPFVSTRQLPYSITLQQIIFGSITVVDNELIEGHEWGSSVMGKGQGYCLPSLFVGSSHTIALTKIFQSGEHHEDEEADSISHFGVYCTASVESHIAVIGGTGKYEHAKGYVVVDGAETVLHFKLYFTYQKFIHLHQFLVCLVLFDLFGV